jgi:hypothetical protein
VLLRCFARKGPIYCKIKQSETDKTAHCSQRGKQPRQVAESGK